MLTARSGRSGSALLLALLLLLAPGCPGAPEPDAGSRQLREVRRFPAPAARQAVAVDAAHVYVIGNHRIVKLEKQRLVEVTEWRGSDSGAIVHLNSGIVIDGKLYCAHSNYPGVPMLSSIEIFDTATLEHVGSHSFGFADGSATWIDRRYGHWWVGFAHYEGRGGEPGKGPEWSRVVKLDSDWRRVASWSYPQEVLERFDGYSNSGAVWGDDGLLYATGHHAREIYLLRLPAAGSVLELVEILPSPMAGQGIAWDPSVPGRLYGIVKKERVVVEAELLAP
ncbi:MAG: hypothetical protein QNK04_08890 [Myxococcota bacterium]|nr:hypothetical protein [Myxococcota bacterium]